MKPLDLIRVCHHAAHRRISVGASRLNIVFKRNRIRRIRQRKPKTEPPGCVGAEAGPRRGPAILVKVELRYSVLSKDVALGNSRALLK